MHRGLQLMVVIPLLASCAKGIWVILPDNVGQDGLLIAEIQSERETISGTSPTIGIRKVNWLQPVVNGTRYDYAIRDGILVLPLPPGDYTLDALSSVSEGTAMPTAVGLMIPISRTSYPIQRRFTIQHGRATYLGQAFISPEDPQETRFRTVWIDNSREAVDYLRALHPRLFASLSSPDFLVAQGNYLPISQLTELRRRVVANQQIKLKTAISFFDQRAGLPEFMFRDTLRMWEGYVVRKPTYIAGNIGTLAYLRPDSADGNYSLLDTRSSADLRHCGFDGHRAVCRLSDSAYLVAQGGVITHRILPGTIRANTMRPFGSSGILVVDHSGGIHVTSDGSNWRHYSGLANGSSYASGSRGDFIFRKGPSGVYALHRPHWDSPTGLVLCNEHSCDPIVLPSDIKRIHGVFEGKRGLLIGPVSTGMFAKASMYMRRNPGAVWEKIPLSKDDCSELIAGDEQGSVLQLGCFGALRSVDGGLTWQ